MLRTDEDKVVVLDGFAHDRDTTIIVGATRKS